MHFITRIAKRISNTAHEFKARSRSNAPDSPKGAPPSRAAERDPAELRRALQAIGLDLSPAQGRASSSAPRFGFNRIVPEPKTVPEATPSNSQFDVGGRYESTWNPLVRLAGDGTVEDFLEEVHQLASTPVEELRSRVKWRYSSELPADDRDVLQFFLDPPMARILRLGAVEPAPLDVAIDAGRPDMVEALLSLKSVPGSEGTHRLRGADPNGSFFGIQRLYAASMRGDHRLVKLLLDAGADPDRANDLGIRDKTGYRWGVEDISEGHHQSSALHAAARGGHLFVAEELLRRGAKVDPERSDDTTPLLEAAAWGRRNAVRLLIAYGANSRAKSMGFMGASLLEQALESKDLGYLKELVQYGAEPRDDWDDLLSTAKELDAPKEILEWLVKEHNERGGEGGAVSASEKRRRVDGEASGLLAAFALRGPERNAVEQSGEASGQRDVRALLDDAHSHIVRTSDRATFEANLKRLMPITIDDRPVSMAKLEPVMGREVRLESLVESLAASRQPLPKGLDVLYAFQGGDRQVVKAVLPDKAAQRIALALMDHMDTGEFALSREELDQLLLGHDPGLGGTTGSLLAAMKLRRSLGIGGPSSSIAPNSAEAPGLPDQKDEKDERASSGGPGGSRPKADSEASPVQPSLLERSDSARKFPG